MLPSLSFPASPDFRGPIASTNVVDAIVMVVPVAPDEDITAEGPGILDAAEAVGEFRLVFQRLDMSLGERVVVGGLGSAVRFGDVEVGQQEGVIVYERH